MRARRDRRQRQRAGRVSGSTPRQQAVDAGLFALEAGQLGPGQRRALGRLHTDGVHPLSVSPDLVVQVRSGREAGGAHEGHHLALVDMSPRPDAGGIARDMAVAGVPAAGVTDAQPVAVAAPGSGLGHDPVSGGQDRRAPAGAEVHALVRAGIAQDRMMAQAEQRGDPRAVDRSLQQEAFDILSEFVVELDVASAREAIELYAPDLGVLQVSGLDRAAGLGDLAVEHQLEVVARLQVALEVDLVGEQLGDLGRDLRRGPDPLRALVERAFDGALGHGGLVAQLFVQFAQAQRPVEGAGQGDRAGGTGAQGQADQPGLARVGRRRRDRRLDQHAGLQMGGVHGLGQHRDRELGLGRADARPAHGAFQGLAALQLDGDAERLGEVAGDPGPGGAGEGGVLQGRDRGGIEGGRRRLDVAGCEVGRAGPQDQHGRRDHRRGSDRQAAGQPPQVFRSHWIPVLERPR